MRSVAVLIRMSDNQQQDTEKSYSAGIVVFSLICIMQLVQLCRWAQHQLLAVPICSSLKVFLLHSSRRNKAVTQSTPTVPNLNIKRMEIPAIILDVLYDTLISSRSSNNYQYSIVCTALTSTYKMCPLPAVFFFNCSS